MLAFLYCFNFENEIDLVTSRPSFNSKHRDKFCSKIDSLRNHFKFILLYEIANFVCYAKLVHVLLLLPQILSPCVSRIQTFGGVAITNFISDHSGYFP